MQIQQQNITDADLDAILDLQHLLKQESVLKDSESTQKNNFKHMVEKEVEKCYVLELGSSGAIVKDDGFENCYTFINQTLLTLSKDVNFMIKMLEMCAGEQNMEKLVPLIVNVLYENMVDSEDEFKDINTLVASILTENIDSSRDKTRRITRNNFLKRKVLEEYMHRYDCTSYGKRVSQNIMISIAEEKPKYGIPRGAQAAAPAGKEETPYTIMIMDYDSKKKLDIEGLPSQEVLSRIKQEPKVTVTRQSERKMSEVSVASSRPEDYQLVLSSLVQTYLDDILRSIHYLPGGLRILCKKIEKHLIGLKASREEIVQEVWKFLFGLYLQQLYFPERYLKSSYCSEHKITLLDKTRSVFSQLAQLSNQPLRKPLSKFIEDILSIPQIPSSADRLKLHAICISYQNLQALFDIIIKYPELKDFNSKIYNRVSRVREMSEDFSFFSKQSKPLSQCYVLFQELVMPETLEIDYVKQYNNIYKEDKCKSILKQILVSCDPLESLLAACKPKDFSELLNHIQREITREESTASDSIPLKVKLKYLVYLEPDFDLVRKMIDETKVRLASSIQLYKNTKVEYLRSLQSLKYYIEKGRQHQQIQENRALKEEARIYISHLRMNYCISSPKSREAQFGSSGKFVIQNHDKIIIEPVETCIHKQGLEAKQQGTLHVSTVSEFLDAFASLEEVRTAVVSGLDKVGITTNLFWFIGSILKRSLEHVMLAQHQEFFKGYLETIITRRIEALIMPRTPTYRDVAIYTRARTLEWLTPSNLRISAKNRVEQVWELCIKCIRDLEKATSVSQKFGAIKQLMRVINGVLLVNGTATGDSIYPMIVYVLIRAHPKRLQSSLNFIELFTEPSKMLSSQGYCFTSVKSALLFMESITEKQLAGVTRQELEKRIYEKQLQIGIAMLRRSKSQEKYNKMEQLRRIVG